MKKTAICLLTAFLVFALIFSLSWAQAGTEKKPAKKPAPAAVKNVDEGVCYGRHPEIQEVKGKGKHAKRLNCAVCHPDTAGHLSDSAQKPVTRLDLEFCGAPGTC